MVLTGLKTATSSREGDMENNAVKDILVLRKAIDYAANWYTIKYKNVDDIMDNFDKLPGLVLKIYDILVVKDKKAA